MHMHCLMSKVKTSETYGIVILNWFFSEIYPQNLEPAFLCVALPLCHADSIDTNMRLCSRSWCIVDLNRDLIILSFENALFALHDTRGSVWHDIVINPPPPHYYENLVKNANAFYVILTLFAMNVNITFSLWILMLQNNVTSWMLMLWPGPKLKR